MIHKSMLKKSLHKKSMNNVLLYGNKFKLSHTKILMHEILKHSLVCVSFILLKNKTILFYFQKIRTIYITLL